MPLRVPCKYCLRPIDTRGMGAHIHFRHAGYVIREFTLNPLIWSYLWVEEGWLPPRLPVALPPVASAGTPLPMLAPVAKGPRWICQ